MSTSSRIVSPPSSKIRPSSMLHRLPLVGASLLAAGIFFVAGGTPSAAATSGGWRDAAEGSLVVEKLVTARRIEHRRAADAGDHFVADGQRVYAFLRVMNKGTTQRLRIVWRRDGRVHHKSALVVKRSPHWRTWAFISARKSLVGSWEVEVADTAGKILAKKTFTIAAP